MFEERLLRARYWVTLALYVLSLLIFIAATVDGTLFLPGRGVGLMQHTGLLILMGTVPLLLLAVVQLLIAVEAVLSNPFEFTQSYLGTAPLMERLSIKTRGSRNRILFIGIAMYGVFTLIINSQRALHPEYAYGRDVFDTVRHPLGFFATRLYLAVIWCAIIPFTVATILVVCNALITLIRFAHRRGTLNVNWFAADNCAGMARLGKLATRTAFVLLLLSSWPIANYYVFGHRGALIVTTIAFAAFSLGVAFVMLLNLHIAVRSARRAELTTLADRIEEALLQKRWSDAADLVVIREGVMTINTWGLPLRYAALTLLMATIQTAIAVLSFIIPSIASPAGA